MGNPALMREAQAALAGPRDRHRASDALRTAEAIAVQLGAVPLHQLIRHSPHGRV